MNAKRAAGRTTPRKRILVVDDHPILREGLRQSIDRQPDLMVCGEAENAAQTLAAIAKLKPDLVLVDISMPGKSGFELVKDLRTVHPDVPVLVLSMHDESLYAERVLRAGARGYIMKHERPKRLLEAMRHDLDGKTYVSEKMAARILDVFSGRRPMSGGVPLERLTDREFEVLHLIGRGKSSHEIARQLHLSVKTVDTHRTHLKEKLRLKSALQLTRYAVCWAEGQTGPRA
jgi:DNA-binding NarL/FixJ family response regulator